MWTGLKCANTAVHSSSNRPIQFKKNTCLSSAWNRTVLRLEEQLCYTFQNTSLKSTLALHKNTSTPVENEARDKHKELWTSWESPLPCLCLPSDMQQWTGREKQTEQSINTFMTSPGYVIWLSGSSNIPQWFWKRCNKIKDLCSITIPCIQAALEAREQLPPRISRNTAYICQGRRARVPSCFLLLLPGHTKNAFLYFKKPWSCIFFLYSLVP